MRKFTIALPDNTLREKLQQKIDSKTKPLGALGKLEDIAMQIGLIQNSLSPCLTNPHLLVFAGDHGIANSGVSAYPQEVTAQMVMNFLQGGAAINVFCRQHQINLQIVDAGVNHLFENPDGLINRKIRCGTHNFLERPAMSYEEAVTCLDMGAGLVSQLHAQGCNVIGFGEMGIGNTSSASLIMSLVCNIPLDLCIGQGTGVTAERLQYKNNVLNKALRQHQRPETPLQIVQTFGGFEIAQMAGAMLQAAQHRMTILVDGFICSAAFLIAHALEPAVKAYSIFCHHSNEKGHALMMNHLNITPLLHLDMRLGEGTGAALAYPLMASAVSFLKEMASFESAGVSEKS